MPDSKPNGTCAVCGASFPLRELFPIGAVRPTVLHEIELSYPEVNRKGYVCHADLAHFRTRYVEGLLISEKGELSGLEEGVIKSLKHHEIMSTEPQADFEGRLTLGQRLADRIATFGGSWTFLIGFFSFLLVWIGINTAALLGKPFDPFPFILLNLLLSCLAAIQAPVIMMSQNRQESKDRLRAEHDYQINLKAELEIRHLHEKMDHLLMQQWELSSPAPGSGSPFSGTMTFAGRTRISSSRSLTDLLSLRCYARFKCPA
ncbi:MAG: DUF1003 domain-containing protein [Verrucomicrobiales bacterium]